MNEQEQIDHYFPSIIPGEFIEALSTESEYTLQQACTQKLSVLQSVHRRVLEGGPEFADLLTEKGSRPADFEPATTDHSNILSSMLEPGYRPPKSIADLLMHTWALVLFYRHIEQGGTANDSVFRRLDSVAFVLVCCLSPWRRELLDLELKEEWRKINSTKGNKRRGSGTAQKILAAFQKSGAKCHKDGRGALTFSVEGQVKSMSLFARQNMPITEASADTIARHLKELHKEGKI